MLALSAGVILRCVWPDGTDSLPRWHLRQSVIVDSRQLLGRVFVRRICWLLLPGWRHGSDTSSMPRRPVLHQRWGRWAVQPMRSWCGLCGGVHLERWCWLVRSWSIQCSRWCLHSMPRRPVLCELDGVCVVSRGNRMCWWSSCRNKLLGRSVQCGSRVCQLHRVSYGYVRIDGWPRNGSVLRALYCSCRQVLQCRRNNCKRSQLSGGHLLQQHGSQCNGSTMHSMPSGQVRIPPRPYHRDLQRSV